MMIKNMDKSAKRDDFFNANYVVLIVLLILNILFSLFTPVAQILRVMMLCTLLATGFMVGKSYYSLNENAIVSIIFGILGIFTVINLFFLVHLIIIFKKGKSGAIRTVNSKNRL